MMIFPNIITSHMKYAFIYVHLMHLHFNSVFVQHFDIERLLSCTCVYIKNFGNVLLQPPKASQSFVGCHLAIFSSARMVTTWRSKMRVRVSAAHGSGSE